MKESSTWRRIGMHILRLAIGAILLWIDQRWLFFYAFVLFLNNARHQDRMRAIARTYQINNEVALLALRRKLDISDDDLAAASDAYTQLLTEQQRQDVDQDFAFARDGI